MFWRCALSAERCGCWTALLDVEKDDFVDHFFSCCGGAVRIVLGALSFASVMYVAVDVRRLFGADTASIVLLLLVSQFHLPFYMSRTLPNTFGTILCMHARVCPASCARTHLFG